MARFALENRILDPEETLDRDALAALQGRRLAETVRRARAVPHHRKALERAGVRDEDLRGPADVRRLPFTVKDDLRQSYPLGLLAVPREQVVRIHGSSGTTGRPTFVAYTRRDLDTWTGLVARFLVAGGLRPEHTVHVAFGYGLFTGGFGLHYGIERVGAAVVPSGGGNTPRQVRLICDLSADVLISTPSYALHVGEVARAEGLKPGDLPLRYGHFGGEPWTEEMRGEIERSLGILAFNNYGLSEVIGPGVAGECPARDGMHVQEDHFIVECLDPVTLEPVPDGEVGELVFTSLTKEAMPVLRYRTRDLAALDRSPCPCGRTGVRMSRVRGRSDDMLIIRGVNVFPSQVEEALLRVEGTAPHYLIEVSRPGALDEAVVKVEVRPEDFRDEMREMVGLRDRIDREIHAVTGIRMIVELVAPNTLERSAGKARRVLDHRKAGPA
ncbi:Phenylacetate--CoA ligase [Anaeromyxobacter dehalogenans 2CP-1]|uniref:Phenylacetate-coenzyme A ligase n=1 Tax=Anaeromyxobacter dehalogenans (strain ATCC BAA-258 / DSM 21875 / 2CP-1) TaxID=455488 RepID=B8J7S0_ANAD2|nr:phenylacetate--CoA ligase [Anaeromyxobacter dehalogenans]ACL63412.1 Phenylacetate--CoA ligase [Anaeromyxobacter dehalogenans 2CP-1]